MSSVIFNLEVDEHLLVASVFMMLVDQSHRKMLNILTAAET